MKIYSVEVRFSGYVTVEVQASSEKSAENKARKAVTYRLAMRAAKPKHGPVITDDFHEVDNVFVEDERSVDDD